jgi:hypothetical protein
MTDLDLEFHFEKVKRNILEKLRQTSEKWDEVWQEAQGNPKAEATLIQLKLEIQLREIEALDKLKQIEEKIRAAEAQDDAK